MQYALIKYKIALQKQKQTEIWLALCKTFVELYDGQCRKQSFSKNIAGKEYKIYSVYYPIGNGMMNIEKAIEDIKFIIETNKKRGG